MQQDPNKLGYIGRKPSSVDRNDWHTPDYLLTLVKRVLVGIDLDPFSSVEANERVKASRFYTPENSAFDQPAWGCKTLFMNPPYGRDVFGPAVERFLAEWAREHIRKSAIILTNNVTETRAGQNLLERANGVCFLEGRVSFLTPDGKRVSNNTRGQMVTFFTRVPNATKFALEFDPMGVIWMD